MNKKWAFKRITVNLTLGEAKRLEEYCENTGRPATDVIRELIRGLHTEENFANIANTSNHLNVKIPLVNP